MKIIGLTGGIASGKSTVGRWLRAAGLAVVDADQVARDVVEPGKPALKALVERFGPEVLTHTGELNRTALGTLVFQDSEARAALNSILHPAIAREAAAQLAAVAAQGADWAVYEVPLLFENNLESSLDATVLVAASEEEQVRRVLRRDGLDFAAARARLAAQMPVDEKRRRAQYVIENDADLATLAARASAVFSTVLGRPISLGGP
jgi:dephospho-CoA kinase